MNIESILTHYDEPHRHYHNRKHIEYMFNTAEKEGVEIKEDDPLWYAILYHDIVYDPTKKDNEEKSIELMKSTINLELYPDQIVSVPFLEQIILHTKNHITLTGKLHYFSILIDLDLAILGDTWEVYREYASNVRKEYSHLTDEEWGRGRSKWLDSMLSRDFIYYTDWGKKREQKAKDNLFQELQHIRLTNLAIRNINERSS